MAARVAYPREWLTERYLPLAWASLAATVLIHLGLGGPVEFQADFFFLLINLGGVLLHRAGSRHVVALHMFALFPLILWYSGEPGGIPQLLGTPVVIYAAILMLPNIILVSLYGLRAAAASTALGLLGVLALGPTGQEFATGAFLVTVSSLVGGLFFHQLIRALEQSERSLAQAAYLDPMTGIGNRRAFAGDFARLAGEDWVLTVWDVDGLKDVNDRYGHAAGDRYLLDFVAALQEACGPSCHVYRLGGDEFAGLHRAVSAPQLVKQVRAAFPNVSAGWLTIGARSMHQAMVEADVLLYADKERRSDPFAPRLVIDLSARATLDPARR